MIFGSCSNRHLWVVATVMLTILGGLAAAAETTAAVNMEGRWTAKGRDLVLDVRACGDKLCGQLVTSGATCGAMVLTVGAEPSAHPDGRPEYIGDLNLPSERAYKVRVSAAGSPLQMHIMGGERVPSLFQRSFPLYLVLSRSGDASCQPRSTS